MVTYLKISDLPVATEATGADELEVNQAGVSRSITIDQVADVVAPIVADILPPPSADWGDITGKPNFDALYVNVAGDTMTGALNGTTATFSSNIITNGGGLYADRSSDATGALVSVRADPGFSSVLYLSSTAGSNRWIVQKTATAEGGSNAGSDFAISAYSDTNTLISTPLTITRSTGAVALTGALTGTSATFSTSTTTPYILAPAASLLILNADAGQRIDHRINNTAVTRLTNVSSHPAVDNAMELGLSASRWSNVYSVLGNFSGALTGTSATMSGTVTTPVVSGGAATLVLNAPTGQRISQRVNNVSIVETQNNAMYPGTTNTIALGATTNRWSTVASVLGDFTGALTGTTATFTGSVQATNHRVTDGNYVFTPFDGVTDTGAVRAGIQFNGNLQTLSFYTAATWRGNVTAAGALSWNGAASFAGALTGTTANFSGAVGVNGTAGSAKFRSSGADADLLGLFSGATKGVRIVTSATETAIEGVDATGGASYQPLRLGGLEVRAPTPTAGDNTTKIATTAFVTAAVAAGGGGASISTGATPPGSPTDNSMWWNSDAATGGGQLYIRYNDGTSTAWVPASPGVGSGAVVQTQTYQTGAVATGTTTIPLDDTIPQITEGTEFMTLAITPRSATSRLLITVSCNVSSSTAGMALAGALFQDSTANALAAAYTYSPTATVTGQLTFHHTMTSGTTSATTFRVRIGSNGAGTTTFNGISGGRIYGGVMTSSIVIQEVL